MCGQQYVFRCQLKRALCVNRCGICRFLPNFWVEIRCRSRNSSLQRCRDYEKITIVSNCTNSIDDRISRVRTALFWTRPPCGQGGCCGWGHSFGWTIVDYLKRSWREPWRGRGGMDGEQRKTWTDRLTDDGWLFGMRDGKLWHLDPAINCGGKLWREIIG